MANSRCAIRHSDKRPASRATLGSRGAGNGKGSTPGTAVVRYGSRHWAIYLNGQLLAVTVYKKGAVAIQEALGSAALRT